MAQGNAPSQITPQSATLEHLCYLSIVTRVIQGCAYMKPPKNFPARYIVSVTLQRAPYRGTIKTLVIPDEPDVPDADDVLQGLAVYDWRRVRRVRQVEW